MSRLPNLASFVASVLLLGMPFLFSLPASAQDAAPPAPESVKAAEELIDSLGMEAVLAKSMESTLDMQMQQFAKMGMSPTGIAELKGEMLAFMKEVMNWEEIRPEFIRLYAESFTAQELEELNAFYQTPTGKKSIQLMPELMQKGMLLGQSKVEARAAELQQRLMPILQKHLGQP